MTASRGRRIAAPASQIARSRLVRQVADLLDGQDAWIVGGAVRDALIGRDVTDLDLAVAGDPREKAARIASALQGHAFELSAEHGTWRVVPRGDRSWQVDVTALRGATIDDDLGARDFTIGAVAIPLSGVTLLDDSAIRDPLGGLEDLESGVLRVVSEASFADDPLRLIRLARLAADLDLQIESRTGDLAVRQAHKVGTVSGERVFYELSMLISSGNPIRGLKLLDASGTLAVIIPEVAAMHGVEQGPNHHLDVFDHTIEVLRQEVDLECEVGSLLTAERLPGVDVNDARDALDEHLASDLADGLSRAAALRFGALFHDLGKPVTRAERDGFIGFPGHDREGASLIRDIARRLAMSKRLGVYLSDLALHHLRLGFMIPSKPLTPRQRHEYLTATGDVAVDVTLLTVADRLSARGSGPIASGHMVEAHLELAAQVVVEALRVGREGMPDPLLKGDEIAEVAEVDPGPELGSLVSELEAAQYAGEVLTRDEAVAHIRGLRDR